MHSPFLINLSVLDSFISPLKRGKGAVRVGSVWAGLVGTGHFRHDWGMDHVWLGLGPGIWPCLGLA